MTIIASTSSVDAFPENYDKCKLLLIIITITAFTSSVVFSPADHRINLKEREKKDKYLDLGREF